MTDKDVKGMTPETAQEAEVSEETKETKKTAKSSGKKSAKSNSNTETAVLNTVSEAENKDAAGKRDETEKEIEALEEKTLEALTKASTEDSVPAPEVIEAVIAQNTEEDAATPVSAEEKEAVKTEKKPRSKAAAKKKSASKSDAAANAASEEVFVPKETIKGTFSAKEAPEKPAEKKEAVTEPEGEDAEKEAQLRAHKELMAKAKPKAKKKTPRRRFFKPYEVRTMKEKQEGAQREVERILGSDLEMAKDTMVGSPSEDVYRENQRFMISDEEREQNLYKELLRYQRYSELLWGTLASVEDDNERKIVYACVLWNDIIVRIPDYLFIEPTYQYGVTYEKMSDEEKMRRRHSTISFMLGAKVCFVVSEINRTLILDRYDKMYNKYDLRVEGNRQRAMEIMRDIFFFHENRKETTRGTQREINEGDVLNARVIQVKEESVLVECGGVETRIVAALLSARDYYTNCTDAFSPGDMMKVRVKKLYLDKDAHTVHLSLTGQIVNPVKAITSIRVGSTYLGTVMSCNEKNRAYTVILSNGVPCSVLFEFVFGHVPLVRGDKVRVYINKIYAERGFVAGSAQKL